MIHNIHNIPVLKNKIKTEFPSPIDKFTKCTEISGHFLHYKPKASLLLED
jgi:hypothetical protein